MRTTTRATYENEPNATSTNSRNVFVSNSNLSVIQHKSHFLGLYEGINLVEQMCQTQRREETKRVNCKGRDESKSPTLENSVNSVAVVITSRREDDRQRNLWDGHRTRSELATPFPPVDCHPTDAPGDRPQSSDLLSYMM
ncbi:unnamed protein product [Heligmosomoides polygyrus]|uniref:Uncharacterized protein n=1 Tax=Heligmosomoides polygyrus TaxID=6339 RepID=A0A183FEV1_HELPZ|nr:unnamed protein product [Heligmosomoides polygyrus]